jgi:hypothetical protein
MASKRATGFRRRRGKGWFTLLRFYNPLQSFFNKTWRPGEIEAVKLLNRRLAKVVWQADGMQRVKQTALLPIGLTLGLTTSSFAQNTPQSSPYVFERGYPTPDTARHAHDDTDFERALTAYRFWYPAVSVEDIFNRNRAVGIQDNEAMAIAAAGPREGCRGHDANRSVFIYLASPRGFEPLLPP